MAVIAKTPSQRLINIVEALGGTWEPGHRAKCRCPVHADRTPSLSLRQGDTGILVHCFAGCKREAILQALSTIQTGRDYVYKDLGPATDYGLSAAKRIWDQATHINGTLAEDYLDRRRITGRYLDLRFHPRCPKGKSPNTIYLPALIIAVRKDFDLLAIQRNFLDSEARCTQKLMLGHPYEAAWRGRSITSDTMAIAEGFEDAARFMDLQGVPCWATLGAGRFEKISIPHGIKHLIIAEDNEPEGIAAAISAEKFYRARGLSVERMNPAPAPDWGAAR